MTSILSAVRLESGYWHIRGDGPCNWTQPPELRADAEYLRTHAFPQASDEFIRSVVKWLKAQEGGGQ